MFSFFHRHQKILMTSMAALSAFSFCFYGLYSTFLGSSGPQDPVSCELADGTPVRQSRRDSVRRLLALEAAMDVGIDRGMFPNLINPGQITAQIIRGGIASIVLERNREAILREWSEILAKQKGYTPYRHPVRSSVGLKTAWGYAAPGLLALIESLPEKVEEGFLPHQLALLEAASQCPAALSHQVLLGMERQARLPHDQALDRAELRPFGHKTLEDWFGPSFVEGCADLILEGAHAAQRAGLRLRHHDVRTEWATGLSSLREQGVDPQNALRWLLSSLHLSEGQAVDGWSQVMLFNQWLDQAVAQEVSQRPDLRSALLSALQRSKEEARIQVLESPIALESVRDLAGFECYLESVGRARPHILELPTEKLTLEQVLRRAPELVSTKVQVRLQRLDRESLRAQMPVKEMVEWQSSDAGWSTLCSRIRALAQAGDRPAAERRAQLRTLDPAARLQTDQLAQDSWVSAHPELLALAWQEAPVEELEWELSAGNCPAPLAGLPSTATLLTWLGRSYPLDVESEGRYALRLLDMKAQGEPHLLSYQQSQQSGVLQVLLDRRLREEWELLKTAQDPLTQEGKTFASAEDRLLRRRTSKVVKALQDYVGDTLGKTLEGPEALAPYRLASHLTTAATGDSLQAEFAARKREETLARGTAPHHQAFELAEGEWSLPFLSRSGLQRIQVLERAAPAAELNLKDPAVQELLAPLKAVLIQQLFRQTAVEPLRD